MSRWTASEEAEVARMVAEGMRHVDIGAAIGRSKSAVCSRIKHLGLQGKRKGVNWSRAELDFLSDHYHRDGWSAEAIGAAMGRTERAVYHKAQDIGIADIGYRYNAAPKDSIQRMVVMVSQGASIQEVATALGVSHNWVSIHLDERPHLKRQWLRRESERRSEGQVKAWAKRKAAKA